MNSEPFICLPVGRVSYRVATRLIVRVRGEDNYSRIYTSDGRSYLLARTLGEVATRLPSFVRTHKGHLVNPAFVSALLYGHYVQLRNGQCLPIARRRQHYINQYFTNQLS